MAAISNQPQGQSWRDIAIERSEGITDAWEVTKTYAGRLAEWILFLCMIANIIEMLPGVALAGWLSNTIMGVQVVMLDVGGFSLASMGDQARENGDERAANKARATGYLLIAIMIITLLLVSVGILWPALRDVTGGVEKGLILVRVVMTVVYGHVLHSLRRRTGGALTPTQVANVEMRMQEQVAQISATSSQMIADVKHSISAQVAQEVAQISTTISGRVAAEVAQKTATIGEGVAAQIAQLQYRLDDENAQRTLSGDQDTALLSEQIGQLVGLVNDQAQIIQHLTNELAGVRREVRTTVTEIRSFAQETPALPTAAVTAIVDVSSEPGERVRAFLQQWSSPKRPTIQAIMDACQVAKKTATRYREDFYGVATSSQNDDEE
jgi:hypothetical protein